MAPPPFSILPMTSAHYAAVARLMGASDPWRTLGITADKALTTITTQALPGIVAVSANQETLGFVRYEPKGFIAHAGYIRTVAVAEQARGQRVGEALVTHAENLMWPVSHLVFLFCSTFNTRGHAFYERLGYTRVGTVDGLVVPQHGEVLFYKARPAP